MTQMESLIERATLAGRGEMMTDLLEYMKRNGLPGTLDSRKLLIWIEQQQQAACRKYEELKNGN